MPDPQAELLTRNLLEVFNERDEMKRLGIIRELYADDAVFHETEQTFHGHEAINQQVTQVLKNFPPDFVFRTVGSTRRNHDAAHVAWTLGPDNGPVIATGFDVALIQDGKLAVLYAFIDSPAT